jgi:hypothetical protein
VGMKVGSVDVKPAPSQALSEKVYDQDPKGGEPIPDFKTAKLWHYTRFGQATPVPETLTGEGFQPGDTALVIPFLVDAEKISPDGKSISARKGPANLLGTSWGIFIYPTPEAAAAEIKRQNDISLSKGAQELILDGYVTDMGGVYSKNEAISYSFTKSDNITFFRANATYRGNFMIFYGATSTKYMDYSLKEPYPTIVDKSKQLIDKRFPRK